MKATFITLITIFVLAAGAVVFGPSFIDWSKYKTQAQDQIKSLTGFEATLSGDLSLALLPAPHLSAKDVTIKANGQGLAAVESLDVNVALIPLFSKQISVQSVELIKPDIKIAILSNGKQNWMTPEIEALQNKKKDPSAPPAQEISLERVTIKDGQFTFSPGAKKTDIVVQKINIELNADKISGPFDVKGDLVYAGKPVAIDAQIEEIKPGAQSLSLKAKGKYDQINFEYAGVVGLKDPFESQGNLNASIASLSTFLNNPALGGAASFKGLVTASKDKAVVKDSAFSILGQNFTGDVQAVFAPLTIVANLKGADTLNLDQFLPKGEKKPLASPVDITQSLPKTLSLPANLTASVNLSIPAAVYNGQTYSNVIASIAKNAQLLSADIKAIAPGGADADIKAALKFASKSPSEKAGTEILSAPVLEIDAKVNAPNIAETARALTGKNDLPYINTAKTGNFDVVAKLAPGEISLSPSTVKLDQETYNLSGALKGDQIVANIGAHGGQLIVKGALNGTQISNMAVQIKHPSLPTALKTLKPQQAPNPLLTGPVDLYTEVQQSGAAYKLSNIQAKILNTSMTGDLTYEPKGGKPSLTGSVKFADLILPSSGTSPAAKQGAGQWSQKPISTDFLHSAYADLEISANSIVFEKWNIAKPDLKFKLTDGALTISQLNAGLFGGQMTMNADVAGQKGGPLSVKSNAKMQSVQIEKLVDALAGNKIIKGTGVVNLDAQIATSGATQAAMINALAGQGAVSGSNIVLQGFDLTKFARAVSGGGGWEGTATGFLTSSFEGGSTAFETLDGAYKIANGIVNIDHLDLNGQSAAIATKGNVNLPKWTLATAHTITVKTDPTQEPIPPFTVNMSGSLSNPGKAFAQGAIQNYLQEKLNKKLNKLITDKVTDKIGGQGGEVLNNLIGGVLGQPQAAPQANPTPEQTAPASGEEMQQAPPQQAPQQNQPQAPATPEEALDGLLQGILSR